MPRGQRGRVQCRLPWCNEYAARIDEDDYGQRRAYHPPNHNEQERR